MAQGDSISGMIENLLLGTNYYYIRPPVGQVWLINYFTYTTETGIFLYMNEDLVSGLAQLKGLLNINLFIDNNVYLMVKFTTSHRTFAWSGVQFK